MGSHTQGTSTWPIYALLQSTRLLLPNQLPDLIPFLTDRREKEKAAMAYRIGDRIGAIVGGDAKRVELLGYGTYQGDYPPVGAGGMGPLILEAGMDNPKLLLENGDVVWGCECWWGPEDQIAAKLSRWAEQGAEIVTVSIADARARAA